MAAQVDAMSTAMGAAVANTAARSNLEPRLCYDDLRQWLEEARKLGEVKDVSGLTWQQDIGMVAGMVHVQPLELLEQPPQRDDGPRLRRWCVLELRHVSPG